MSAHCRHYTTCRRCTLIRRPGNAAQRHLSRPQHNGSTTRAGIWNASATATHRHDCIGHGEQRTQMSCSLLGAKCSHFTEALVEQWYTSLCPWLRYPISIYHNANTVSLLTRWHTRKMIGWLPRGLPTCLNQYTWRMNRCPLLIHQFPQYHNSKKTFARPSK
ncbi:hypothetical protein LZ30DRAFT_312860 [Colletotrichum cereale]|nr:hypothetical protein LZ30DRAFT_312860 [Colletotrichum cereale]